MTKFLLPIVILYGFTLYNLDNPFSLEGQSVSFSMSLYYNWLVHVLVIKRAVGIEAAYESTAITVFRFLITVGTVISTKQILEDYRTMLGIRTKVVRMKKGRKPADENDAKWIAMEGELRYRSYSTFWSREGRRSNNEAPRLPNSITDDNDMNGDYYLCIVYCLKFEWSFRFLKFEPLASARFYTTQADIIKELEGEEGVYFVNPQDQKDIQRVPLESLVSVSDSDNCCLIDRLSIPTMTGHKVNAEELQMSVSGELYCKIRETVQASTYLAIARREKTELLLRRYMPLGFTIKGMTKYKIGGSGEAKEFWVLKGSWQNMCQQSRRLRKLLQIVFRFDKSQ